MGFRDRMNQQRSKLDEMKERMKNYRSGGGTNFWKPPEGKSIIRILPPVGDMEYPWQLVGRHNLGDDDKSLLCPSFTTDEQLPCPICELANEAYRANDKKMLGKLKVRRTFQMNVIIRSIKDNEEDSGPYVWTPGVSIFEALTEVINDPEYGDVSDPLEGFDMKISRKGKGLETEYLLNVSRNRTPIFGTAKQPDDERIQLTLDSAIDLSKVLNDLPTYEDLNSKISSESVSDNSESRGSNSSAFDDDEDL